LVIPSFAKVNLHLCVLNKRADNYHNLRTLFERITLNDKIILTSRKDNLIKVSCSALHVPSDESNICWKAAKLLQDKMRIKRGLNIRIVKRIPVGAGLGGGSGNAAAVLLGLNKLWKMNLSKPKLAQLAAKIGSDVAFFIYESSFALGYSRGERIRILNNPKGIKLWHILIVPKIHVSTPLIYKKFDHFRRIFGICKAAKGVKKWHSTGLTKSTADVKLLTSILAKKTPSFAPGLLFNNLEEVTLKLYPEVKRIKDKLLALGLKDVLMSGSGPAVFALLPSAKDAYTLSRILKREEHDWRIFVVKTA
jgi:4-diphosphocytidyl-2-C-methyl-D-erythritol kinase